VYIFGGFGGSDSWLGDLWALDTQSVRVRDVSKAIMSWHKPPSKGAAPCARAAHSATMVGGRMYIFGGNTGKKRLNDLYSLDTQASLTAGGHMIRPKKNARSNIVRRHFNLGTRHSAES